MPQGTIAPLPDANSAECADAPCGFNIGPSLGQKIQKIRCAGHNKPPPRVGGAGLGGTAVTAPDDGELDGVPPTWTDMPP